MKDIEKKRLKEQRVVEQMILMYCHKKHKTKHELCLDCQNLCHYAKMRSERCPFMETKTFCANCKVHCYKPKMREEIRKVMRFSGPRLLLYHPIMCCWHMITSQQEKRKLKE